MRPFLAAILAVAFVAACRGAREEGARQGFEFDIPVDTTLEGSEAPAEQLAAEEARTGGEAGKAIKGIRGTLSVHNTKSYPLTIWRGAEGRNFLGAVPPAMAAVLPVGDFSGCTRLWARNATTGTVIARRDVCSNVWNYRWNI